MTPDSDRGPEAHERPAHITLQSVLGGAALAVIALACGWTLYANLAGTDHNGIAAGPTVTVVAVQPTAVTVAVKTPAAPAEADLLTAPSFDIALLDAPDWRYVAYHLAGDVIETVIKNGAAVAKRAAY